ncbi:hypothetical protein AMBR_LLDLPDMO_03023 [Lactiplantibacillus plantarum]|nr:hypothetical protein [Lactiplantibacillus plantarum]ALC08984.1 hypothetical protein JM48_1777 [Lactiplantibacillus plantarum]MCG0570345.1 hypothetical protein [Lactiplantibacillus plantarum]MCG0672455.1 hypothetical protein [Lactiplantibacillus plantarum]MCG0780700.1 hypothetical protein [Lactiplantibacillus plantarum]MCG0808378.1 hypothetical protein [Lactiplantibacillus plantarum]
MADTDKVVQLVVDVVFTVTGEQCRGMPDATLTSEDGVLIIKLK